MIVSQILKTKALGDVITAAPDTTVQDIAHLLSLRKIGAVVISSDGKKVDGIVSERDIVRELGAHGVGCLTGPVTHIMTRNVVCCTMTESANAVSQRMSEGRFRHMPVMGEGGLLGVISMGDVVKARLSELAMEKDALEGMIKGF